MKSFLAIILLSAIVTVSNAQHSGNAVYGNNASQYHNPEAKKLYLSDSTFLIEAHVLINTIADDYVATIGVSDTSASLKESSDRINKRIKGFMATLSKFGIRQQDIYVDMTTQTKVYDYTLKHNYAQQYVKGYEIKKNVVIKFKNIADLENMMIEAANFKIYDLAKVDYVVNDLEKINTELFKLAIEVINRKKEMYVMATNCKLNQASQIYGEDYYSYYPQQLYKTYIAEASTDISSEYASQFIKRDLQKPSTVYYDKIDYSGFDKIINPEVTEPAIEFGFTLQIKFQMEKGK